MQIQRYFSVLTRYFILPYKFCSATSAIHVWDNETLSVEVNKVFDRIHIPLSAEDKYLSLRKSCARRHDLSSGGCRGASEMVPDIQQWFKYSEARGQNVALLYITVIFFFFLSFHRRIRFSGSLRPVIQPLSSPRRFALVLRGYYLRDIEIPIPHYDDESLKPFCSSLLSEISLKIRGVLWR